VADIPEVRAHDKRRLPGRIGFALDAGPRTPQIITRKPGAIALFGGVPDLREAPTEFLARAYRRAMRRHATSVLGYASDPRGHPRLRRSIAQLVRATRGIDATEDEVIITRGSQMAIHLALRAILRPGDVACVEALGYPPAWAALEHAGAKVVGIPVDKEGIDVKALDRIDGVRVVYVTPHHQYPTTVVLSASRRIELLEIARRRRIAILEDDYDHEFHYDGWPVLPLASNDASGVVVYIGTLSKILAPGLRIGFVVAPRPLVDRLARERFLIDRQGDFALELAVAELMEDDELGRHARKMRRLYRARRDTFAEALQRELRGLLTFEVPTGGMALWAAIDPGIDVDRWAARAADRGVLFQPGSMFSLRPRRVHAARFGFASSTEAELARAARILRQSVR
jgi:GntR family transcriptional regulator/MocR family aminotransferase